MAQIQQAVLIVKLSHLIKDNQPEQPIIPPNFAQALEQAAQAAIGDNSIIVEIEQA